MCVDGRMHVRLSGLAAASWVLVLPARCPVPVAVHVSFVCGVLYGCEDVSLMLVTCLCLDVTGET